MIYSSQELLNATDNFSQDRIVGKGGFGVVYRARLRMCDVAVKHLTEVRILLIAAVINYNYTYYYYNNHD
jgi:hypothetical protein